MVKTRTDLVHRALKNLGVLPHGQTPSAEEFNAVDELVDPMVEDLIARDVAFIEDADVIEDKYFTHLGNILAGLALPEFGMVGDVNMLNTARLAEQDLEDMDRRTIRYSHLRHAVDPHTYSVQLGIQNTSTAGFKLVLGASVSLSPSADLLGPKLQRNFAGRE